MAFTTGGVASAVALASVVWLASGTLAAQASHASKVESARGELVLVTGPTLISSFVATQTEVDTSSDVNEALSDYQYYLSLATPVLERSGVRVVLSNDSTIRWHDRRGTHRLSAVTDGIVYLFVLPDGRMKELHRGVESDESILAAAREFLRLPIPDPRRDSIGSAVRADTARQTSFRD